jgi:ATP-dependent DNA helicase RecG
MASTTDGFRIAEFDLELRGPGDFFGTRQSGVPEFRVANVLTDADILEAARADAFALVETDPELSHPDHRLIAQQLRTRFREDFELLRTA